MFNLRPMVMHAESSPEQPGAGGGDSLRDTLTSAFEQHTTPEPTPTPAAPTPEAAAPPDGRPRAGETPQQTAERVRDERGRFAAKPSETITAGSVAEAQAKAAAAPVGKPEAAPEPQTPHPATSKAPQSWKPEAREAWASLPPLVQEQVLRREAAIARTLQETAQARNVVDSLGQMHQYFAPVLQAEGVDLLTAAGNAMQMVSRLRFGTPQERASIVAGLVGTYGVDIHALDAALAGQPQPQGQQPQEFRDPRFDQFLGALEAAKSQRLQAVQQQAVTEVERFGQGKEFFADVREDMADLLELASKRGLDLTLEQAYERACQMHPSISRVVAQRAAASGGQNSQQSTARAMAAASSIRSTPAIAPRTEPESRNLRGDIEAAWAAAADRR